MQDGELILARPNMGMPAEAPQELVQYCQPFNEDGLKDGQLSQLHRPEILHSPPDIGTVTTAQKNVCLLPALYCNSVQHINN